MSNPTSPALAGSGERRATNYKLAHELGSVVEWIGRHAFSGVDGNAALALVARAQNALRGATEPVTDIRELLLNDPWAAAIADHVRAMELTAARTEVEGLRADKEQRDRLLTFVAWMANETAMTFEDFIVEGESHMARTPLPQRFVDRAAAVLAARSSGAKTEETR